MLVTTGDERNWKFFAVRYAARLFALLLFVSCATALRAQTVQIMLINGKTGQPIKDHPLVYVWVGHVRQFPFMIATDKQGVALLRLTHNESEINVPDCKGMKEDSEKLQRNRNKKDEEDFNKKYKNCTQIEVDNPVVRFADSISIGLVSRTLNGRNYFLYVPCWAVTGTGFSTEEVLQHGVVTANNCGKATASPGHGQLILFMRSPTQWEAARQAWN